ncbi:glycosyltransferase 87 family protein [Streptomyces sp. NPDC050095]|uniref:glycosyltransferase 87 family protein n=1 Tax=unclassified Streptomyces TaxID=2593676 RepID=UPI003422BC8F
MKAPPAQAAPESAAPVLRASAALAALVAALILTVRSDTYYADPAALSWWYLACWLLFALTVWCLRKVPARQVAGLVMAGAVAVSVTGLVAPPRTSTDSYRYVWDGRVQHAGISPYDHVPEAARLAPLRDAWLFPEGAACDGPGLSQLPPVDGEQRCTRINRPAVHTIYPPVAEGYFFLVDALSPDGARTKPVQLGGALISVATSGLLLWTLRRRRGDPRHAALWAWCPAVALEAVNNAHVDALGALFTVAGLGLVLARRTTGAALLGAGIATKLLPAVVLPGALSGVRRWRDAAAVLVPAAAVVALAYLPYALLSRSSVLGYLTGYVSEEGYDDPSGAKGYALLRLVLPDSWAVAAVAVVMAAVVAHVVRRGDPARPWSGALVCTGAAFLLMTPGYSWYSLLLVALVALDGRWEWLAIAAAGAAKYVAGRAVSPADTVTTTAYALAAAVVVAGWLLRRRAARLPASRPAVPGEPGSPSYS